jgi:alkylation response protein AidB-like acyl-CoA dehydrogenase
MHDHVRKAAMRDAGVFRMFVPPALGGLDLDLTTSVDALAELANGDPSARWVLMILGAADLSCPSRRNGRSTPTARTRTSASSSHRMRQRNASTVAGG